jgi:small subunit ribosomal protein S1
MILEEKHTAVADTPELVAEETVKTVPSPKLDLAKLYDETVKNFTEGQIVKGRVVALLVKEVLIDIGYKSEGRLSLDEFPNPSSVKVGDTVEVLFEASENDEGMVVVSKRKADRLKCWNNILATATEGSVIEGRVFKRVTGGFMVDIGMEAFLPASLVDLKPAKNLDQFVGLVSKFKIVKINPKRKNIVLSRKDYLEIEKDELRAKKLAELKEGDVVKGRVKNITDFGAFIDLGGADGLLHITDMSWGRISHPSELVEVGREAEVMIVGFDRETQRISLGLKQLTPDPWKDVDKKYPVNSKVKGKVVNILPYGAFVELERGVEGLVHVSELSWTKRVHHPSEVLHLGDEVEAIVLTVEKEARKVALGIKQVENNPWLTVDQKYPVATVVEGKVKNITDYGLFVEIEPGVGGLIHISDISWTKRVNHPGDLFKKGDTVTARVLSVDSQARKISLGLKQLEADPWKDFTKDLTVGLVLTGKVTKVVHFGVFVELKEGIEGLIHISEIPDREKKRFPESFKAGDESKVKVLRIDEENHRIALSLKLR